MKGPILVVDDDRQMVKTLCAVLRHHGWETVQAYSGEDAVRTAEAHQLSAVLMDVKMSGMNGLDAFRGIRARQPHLPVILMTAYSAHELVVQAEREGVLTVLPKPLPWPRLIPLLEEALGAEGSVLVVDDDPQFLQTLGKILTEQGHAALKARSLNEALVLMEKRTPGVVVLDLKLDHQEPNQAVMAIKQVSPTVALILYSGHPRMLDETVAGLPQGWVYAALKKPFPPERLIELLDAISRR